MIVEMRWSKVVLAAAVGVLCGRVFAADDEIGKILRPADHSSFESSQVDVVATAPSGKLQLDGAWMKTEQPFPFVFHTVMNVSPGLHSLALVWDGGKKESAVFCRHESSRWLSAVSTASPLSDVQCTQCHGLNKRGRFIFKGGCFSIATSETDLPRSILMSR